MPARDGDPEGGTLLRVVASRWWLAAVLLLAAALRVGYLLELSTTPWFDHLVVDPEYYDAWARRLAAGDWLGEGAFYMDPLYPYVLGIVYALGGHDLWLPRLLNVACSLGACACVAVLGRRVAGRALGGLAGPAIGGLAGPALGGVAAMGLAVYEPDIFFVGEIDKTSLSTLLVAGALVAFLSDRRRTRVLAGFLLGLAALTRANLLVLAPLAAGVMLFEGPAHRPTVPAARAAALFLAAFALAIAPVTWRNHHVSGEWVLTTTQLGQNFYTGNNPENPYGAYGVVAFVRANPHFEEVDFHAAAEARSGRTFSAGAASWFWVRATLAHIAGDPGFAFRAFGRKAVLFWNDFEISDSQDQYLLERYSRILRLPLLGFGEVFAFAVLGGLVYRSRRGSVRILLGFVGVYWATIVLFFLFARYRVQIVPALLPLAALGLTELVDRTRRRDVRAVVAALGVLAVAGWFSFQTIGLFSVSHPNVVEMRLRRLADAEMTMGRPERAIAALQEAVPNCLHGCPWALADLFEIYRRSGRVADGVAYFEAFIARHPEQRDAPEYLAKLRANVPTP